MIYDVNISPSTIVELNIFHYPKGKNNLKMDLENLSCVMFQITSCKRVTLESMIVELSSVFIKKLLVFSCLRSLAPVCEEPIDLTKAIDISSSLLSFVRLVFLPYSDSLSSFSVSVHDPLLLFPS